MNAATIKDRRQGDDFEACDWVICGKDEAMSGWGMAHSRSFTAWACTSNNVRQVLREIEDREDITYINVKRMPSTARNIQWLQRGDHLSIYVRR